MYFPARLPTQRLGLSAGHLRGLTHWPPSPEAREVSRGGDSALPALSEPRAAGGFRPASDLGLRASGRPGSWPVCLPTPPWGQARARPKPFLRSAVGNAAPSFGSSTPFPHLQRAPTPRRQRPGPSGRRRAPPLRRAPPSGRAAHCWRLLRSTWGCSSGSRSSRLRRG